MANYNNAKYVAESIQSILKQTYNYWELIIIDDCSTDNSRKIIKSFLQDKRIKFFKNKKNIGYIGTLKKMIGVATADIIGILDSDDALTKNAIEMILNIYKKHPDCGLIYSQFMYCDSKLNEEKIGYCRSIPKNLTNLNCDCVSHFKTFKKSDYLKTNGYDKTILYSEDKDFIFKIEEVAKLFFIDKILYKYRFLPNSQNNDPLKSQIGKISFTAAKFNAYQRRIGTKIPNLSKKEIICDLIKAIFLCLKIKNYKQAKNFLKKIIQILKNAKNNNSYNMHL